MLYTEAALWGALCVGGVLSWCRRAFEQYFPSPDLGLPFLITANVFDTLATS